MHARGEHVRVERPRKRRDPAAWPRDGRARRRRARGLERPRHERPPHPSQQPPQHLDIGVPLASAEGRQRGKLELRLRERQERRLRLEAPVPADRRAFELLRLLLGEEVEVGGGSIERGLNSAASSSTTAPVVEQSYSSEKPSSTDSGSLAPLMWPTSGPRGSRRRQPRERERPPARVGDGLGRVERTGIEPVTSGLQSRRSPS